MNKKFYGTLLLGTLLLGSTIVSCKDYDDDIDNLQNQITQLATKADMQSEVSKLQSAVATAQAAAENKAAAAEQAAKDAAAKAQAAADAAAKAQGTADAAATVEALNKVAADAAAAAQAAEDAKAAAEAKAAELAAQLAELQALAATLVSTKDFDAAKKELNDKYDELAAKIGETTGTTGMTGLQVISGDIAVGYGVWKGVHKGAATAEWDGPKKDEVAKLSKGDYISAFGANEIQIAVNPTDVDVTNTEFAVVNQFGEIAPVAFGTPEVLTRANAAGTYKVKVASAALTSDVVKEFGKKFEKNTKGANAALVAGKIASTITENFVAVTENKNSDKSAFSTTVKYDEISGVVEVAANNPEYVYDSYITKLDASVDAHDALLWKLKYDGMTLTYNAEAAKKFAGKEFKVVVKQINLNGYIHETVETVKFEAKNTTTEIEMDAVDAKLHTHNVQLDEKSPTTDEDLQFIVLTKDEIIKALDLKKGTDEYIHFGHSKYATADVTVGKSFAYTAENDTVEFAKAAATPTVDKDGNITLKFDAGYPKANFMCKIGDTDVDFITSGSTMYIPVTFVATDETDLDGDVKTTYTINVPVKFVMPDVESLYNWHANMENPTPGKYYKFAQQFKAKDITKIEYLPQTPKENEDGTYSPRITANLDYSSLQSYKNEKAAIDALVISNNAASVETESGADIQLTTVSPTTKKAAQEALIAQYMNLVKASHQTYAFNNHNGSWTIAAGKETDVTEGFRAQAVSTTESYTYTIKGLKAKLLTLDNREVSLKDLVITKEAGTVTTSTMTVTYDKFFNDTYAPAIQLYNSYYAPVASEAGKFKGSFTAIDKYDEKLQVESSINNEDEIVTLNAADITIVKANGTTTNPTVGKIKITAVEYAYGTAAGAKAMGMKINLETVLNKVEAGDKILLTIPDDKLERISLPEDDTTEPVIFELTVQ